MACGEPSGQSADHKAGTMEVTTTAPLVRQELRCTLRPDVDPTACNEAHAMNTDAHTILYLDTASTHDSLFTRTRALFHAG